MAIPHRTVGTGPHTVFCLHGWFGSSDGWGTFPDWLDTGRFTYVFTDNRGYGARRDETGDYTLDEVAGDVIALADQLGADRFSLIGHSMGGSEVLKVLALAPERVTSLVGLSPVGAQPTALDEAGHELFYGAYADRDKRCTILDFTTGNRLTRTWVDAVADWSLAHSSVDGFKGAGRAWLEADFLDDVTGTNTPIHVIVGEHDPALGETTVNQTWTPYFPNCTVEVMPNAAQYPMFETPVALATSVERFLSDQAELRPTASRR